MDILNKISQYIFPVFLFCVFLYSFLKKNDTFSSFIAGAKQGISTIFGITPNILAIMAATAVFRESGALEFLLRYITPALKLINVPSGVVELILLRPISGSGSMVLLTDIYKNYTPDSYEGILASVIAASSETTIYTVMIYFGVTSARKTKIPLAAGLLTDIFVVVIAVIVISLMRIYSVFT